jgi:cytochrome P450
MDVKVWSDANNTYPVDTFWPGRFLNHSDNSTLAQFSFHSEGSWLPFGSSANLCPGRHSAKVHCIVTLAMIVDTFDCEILAGRKAMELDLRKFGMGVLGPRGKVPALLWRRVLGD